MKFFWCYLIAALITVSNGAVDVEKTVKHVQSILQANTLLPRLTRDEILQLLNDIRAEDAKSVSTSRESKEESKEITTTPFSTIENEINPETLSPNINDNTVPDQSYSGISASSPTKVVETTTNKNEPTLMVVLPYTPRDGSSLQELYTRPPRVEVVKVPTTPKAIEARTTTQHTPKPESNKDIDIIPEELKAFLDAHRLNGKPGQDHFLLPLDGFKPLPPAKIVDGTVQLPENILLTYDLISPNTNPKANSDGRFLYEPLRPEVPFELETSSSDKKEVKYPFDMPKRDGTKTPNYDPIDYDSVKVIPLNKDINPLNEQVITNNEQSKRQASSEAPTTQKVETTTVTEAPITNEPPAADSVPSDTDTGASIADLEDSFGGAAPSMPGDSELPPPRKNGFYWMLDWNSFLEVGDDSRKVNIRFEPKLGDPQMFLPVSVP